MGAAGVVSGPAAGGGGDAALGAAQATGAAPELPEAGVGAAAVEGLVGGVAAVGDAVAEEGGEEAAPPVRAPEQGG